jgi:hypothetical protein
MEVPFRAYPVLVEKKLRLVGESCQPILVEDVWGTTDIVLTLSKGYYPYETATPLHHGLEIGNGEKVRTSVNLNIETMLPKKMPEERVDWLILWLVAMTEIRQNVDWAFLPSPRLALGRTGPTLRVATTNHVVLLAPPLSSPQTVRE